MKNADFLKGIRIFFVKLRYLRVLKIFFSIFNFYSGI